MVNVRITIYFVVLTLVVAAGVDAEDFILTNDEHLDISTVYGNGTLLNFSTADVLEGGYIDSVVVGNEARLRVLEGPGGGTWGSNIYFAYAYNSSVVDISGGEVGFMYSYDDSRVNISGGYVFCPVAYGNSTVTVSSDGELGDLYAYDNSTVISSSGADTLRSYDNSTVEIHDEHNDSAHAYGNSKLYLYGINGDELQSFDSSTVNTISGNYGYRSTVSSYGTSTMNVFQGRYITTELTAQNFSTMNLTNVYIESPSNEDDFHSGITALENSIVNIKGGNFIGSLVSANASTVNIYGGSFFPIDHSWIGPEFPLCGGVSTSGTSTMNIFGGYMDCLDTYSDSTVNISGGRIGGESSFHIFGGLYVYGNSNVNIFDGYVDRLFVNDNGFINVSGGSISELYALDFSSIIFDGYDFDLGVGLLWDVDGGTILGTGILTGKWFDGTSWTTEIYEHDAAATIIIIPEPATISLFVFGGLLLRRKK